MIRTAKTTAVAHSPAKTSAAKRTAVAAATASATPIASAGLTNPAAKPAERRGQASGQTITPSAPTAKLPTGKLGALVALLQTGSGTTIEAMMEATGWQAHSVRGAISGSLKKKLGFEILSEKTGAGRVYRIASAAKAPQS
jgi:hypothetical protein